MKIITSYLSRSKIQIAKILLIWVQERSFLRSGSQNSLVGVYKISYLEVSKISFNAKRAGLGLGWGVGGGGLGTWEQVLLGRRKKTLGPSWPVKKFQRLSHLSALIVSGNTRFQQNLVDQGFSTMVPLRFGAR